MSALKPTEAITQHHTMSALTPTAVLNNTPIITTHHPTPANLTPPTYHHVTQHHTMSAVTPTTMLYKTPTITSQHSTSTHPTPHTYHYITQHHTPSAATPTTRLNKTPTITPQHPTPTKPTPLTYNHTTQHHSMSAATPTNILNTTQTITRQYPTPTNPTPHIHVNHATRYHTMSETASNLTPRTLNENAKLRARNNHCTKHPSALTSIYANNKKSCFSASSLSIKTNAKSRTTQQKPNTKDTLSISCQHQINICELTNHTLSPHHNDIHHTNVKQKHIDKNTKAQYKQTKKALHIRQHIYHLIYNITTLNKLKHDNKNKTRLTTITNIISQLYNSNEDYIKRHMKHKYYISMKNFDDISKFISSIHIHSQPSSHNNKITKTNNTIHKIYKNIRHIKELLVTYRGNIRWQLYYKMNTIAANILMIHTESSNKSWINTTCKQLIQQTNCNITQTLTDGKNKPLIYIIVSPYHKNTYIGETTDIESRFHNDISATKKLTNIRKYNTTQHTQKEKMPRSIEYWANTCYHNIIILPIYKIPNTHRVTRLRLEKHYIKTLNPSLNVKHKPARTQNRTRKRKRPLIKTRKRTEL